MERFAEKSVAIDYQVFVADADSADYRAAGAGGWSARRAFCLTTRLPRGGAIDRHASWLIPTLMGTLQPFLIITGTAWAMTPIATGQLSKSGYEMINGPGDAGIKRGDGRGDAVRGAENQK